MAHLQVSSKIVENIQKEAIKLRVNEARMTQVFNYKYPKQVSKNKKCEWEPT